MGTFIDGFFKKKIFLARLTHFIKTLRSFNWFLIGGREKSFPFWCEVAVRVKSCHSRSRLSVSKPDKALHKTWETDVKTCVVSTNWLDNPRVKDQVMVEVIRFITQSHLQLDSHNSFSLFTTISKQLSDCWPAWQQSLTLPQASNFSLKWNTASFQFYELIAQLNIYQMFHARTTWNLCSSLLTDFKRFFFFPFYFICFRLWTEKKLKLKTYFFQ